MISTRIRVALGLALAFAFASFSTLPSFADSAKGRLVANRTLLHRGGGIIVHRECRQWQHNVAFSGSIPSFF